MLSVTALSLLHLNFSNCKYCNNCVSLREIINLEKRLGRDNMEKLRTTSNVIKWQSGYAKMAARLKRCLIVKLSEALT